MWLEPLEDTHITGIRWTPVLDRGQVGLGMALRRGAVGRLEVRVQLSLHDEQLVDDSYLVAGTDFALEIAVDPQRLAMDEEQVLWSPEHPNLIEATIDRLSSACSAMALFLHLCLRQRYSW